MHQGASNTVFRGCRGACWPACATRIVLQQQLLTHCAQVTLVTPWIARCDQELVFPNNATFDSPSEQEAAIREWVRRRSGHSPDFRIVFYAGASSQDQL